MARLVEVLFVADEQTELVIRLPLERGGFNVFNKGAKAIGELIILREAAIAERARDTVERPFIRRQRAVAFIGAPRSQHESIHSASHPGIGLGADTRAVGCKLCSLTCYGSTHA